MAKTKMTQEDRDYVKSHGKLLKKLEYELYGSLNIFLMNPPLNKRQSAFKVKALQEFKDGVAKINPEDWRDDNGL